MDSFTLLLNQESEYEVDFNKFERTPKYLFELPYKPPFYGKKGQFYSTCKIIKIKGEKYLPQVTIYTNKNLYGHYPYLYIRFSAPKIIFGDNYNELTDKDFKKLVKKLVKILRKMGVKTSVKVIINARVVEAHFAKNFIFPDEQTLYDFFYLLEKTKFPYLKGMPNSYENGGRSFRYHKNTWAISFYDKLPQLSIDHPELVTELRAKVAKYILRAEVQINDIQKMKRFEKYGINNKNSFSDIFQFEKFIAVFDEVLMTLNKNAPALHLNQKTLGDTLKSIKGRTKSELQKIGFILPLQREHGIAGAEKIISELMPKGHKTFLAKHKHELTSNQYMPNIFLKLRSIVKEYKPIQDSTFDIQKFIDFEI